MTIYEWHRGTVASKVGGVMDGKKVLVLGPDERQQFLFEALKKKRWDVSYQNISEFVEAEMADIMILPVAPSKKLCEIIVRKLHAGQTIYGGVLNEEFCKSCKEKEVTTYDYMKNESVAIRNAVATAEGAIAEAIILGNTNLQGSKCLVIGMGKCGEILADKLKGLKCDVSVMVRSEEKQAKAEAYGYKTIWVNEGKELGGVGKKIDYIFNTAPALVIDKAFLTELRQDVIIIDLASKPGGVDFDACMELGMIAKSCLGLPGKYAPKTSGEILAKAIIQIETQKEKVTID